MSKLQPSPVEKLAGRTGVSSPGLPQARLHPTDTTDHQLSRHSKKIENKFFNKSYNLLSSIHIVSYFSWLSSLVVVVTLTPGLFKPSIGRPESPDRAGEPLLVGGVS